MALLSTSIRDPKIHLVILNWKSRKRGKKASFPLCHSRLRKQAACKFLHYMTGLWGTHEVQFVYPEQGVHQGRCQKVAENQWAYMRQRGTIAQQPERGAELDSRELEKKAKQSCITALIFFKKKCSDKRGLCSYPPTSSIYFHVCVGYAWMCSHVCEYDRGAAWG